MSYKYQQDILSILHEDVERHIENKNYIRKGQQNFADMHRCDTKRMSGELNEVYAKAKAFDEIKGVAFWYFEIMRPNFKNSAEYESFYEVIRNELKEIESEAD